MSDDDKSNLVDELAARLQAKVEAIPAKKKGLLVYRTMLFALMTGGAALATKIYTKVDGLVSVPTRVEAISKSVAELKSAADVYDSRFTRREEFDRVTTGIIKTQTESREWSLKHGSDIEELKQFRATAKEKLSNIDATTLRIETKLDGRG